MKVEDFLDWLIAGMLAVLVLLGLTVVVVYTIDALMELIA